MSYQYFAEQKALCTAVMFSELVLVWQGLVVQKSKIVKEERGSMVKNCFNVEDGSLIFNLIKNIMLIVLCCLH